MRYLMLTILMLSSLGFAIAKPADGPELFTANKCVKCHTVDSLKIATTSKKPDDVHDLSKAGADFADAAELKAFLKKESERDGKKHKFLFKGEEADLDQIVTWLLTLK